MKDTTITFRVSTTHKEKIKQYAELRNLSITDYLLQSALNPSRYTIFADTIFLDGEMLCVEKD